MKNKQKYLNYIKNLLECYGEDINKIDNTINQLSNVIDNIDNDLNNINCNTIVYKQSLIDFINTIKDDNNMIDLIDIYNFIKYCIHPNIEKLCVYDHDFKKYIDK